MAKDLEKIELSTPNLHHLYFYRAVLQPCVFELIDTRKLKRLTLNGEYIIEDNMFSDCDTTFSVLEDLTLGCSHYMPDRIKISSRLLKDICLFDLKKAVDITIDVEALVCIRYKDHLIHNFSNSNIPNVQNAMLEFNTYTNQEPDDSWFQKLVGMLQAFKPSATLLLKAESDKSCNPRRSKKKPFFFPPISVGPETLMVEIDKTTESVADLLDFIFWISPRAEDVTICRERAVISLQMKHGEISGISQNHSCCASYPEKCWRHSLEEPIDITIDAPELDYFFHRDHLLVNSMPSKRAPMSVYRNGKHLVAHSSNTTFPKVARATIKSYLNANHESDKLWFKNLLAWRNLRRTRLPVEFHPLSCKRLPSFFGGLRVLCYLASELHLGGL
ncbi:F-box domain, cyclin-like protein [Artemisia annua]|uniref:F-box domain, cyclin-like protein n=1 Tax=Artemisia annua TaxID=35608 RepID=A0A2U1MNE1_ARTAN|nr:F-box domain, cyclin-like protein [Artemisia annua]